MSDVNKTDLEVAIDEAHPLASALVARLIMMSQHAKGDKKAEEVRQLLQWARNVEETLLDDEWVEYMKGGE